MAGIKEAKDLDKNNMNEGRVLYKGEFIDNELLIKFLLIELENDKGIITQFDYGSDLRFDNNISVGNYVYLKIIDDYTAEWRIK